MKYIDTAKLDDLIEELNIAENDRKSVISKIPFLIYIHNLSMTDLPVEIIQEEYIKFVLRRLL